jgi:hypothetical protein
MADVLDVITPTKGGIHKDSVEPGAKIAVALQKISTTHVHT